jgi:putative ABC transport system substrate-binding protein
MVASLAACAAPVAAQSSVRRIGVLFPFPRRAPGGDPRWDAIVEGLRALGYVDGGNIVFVYAYSEGDPDRRLREAARLVAARPDVIIAAVGADALALRRSTTTIPIVVAGGGDLVRTGVVESLARPGGNVTGVQVLQPDLAGKRLQMLKAVAPAIRRVGVLHEKLWADTVRDYYERLVADVEAAAKSLGMDTKATALDGAADVDAAVDRLRADGVDAMYVASSPFMMQNRQRLTQIAAKHRLPAIYENAVFVEAGGLMSYGVNLAVEYRRVARYVDRILKGALPAELAVEQPEAFELKINAKAARHLGFTVPPSLLANAELVDR